MTRALDAEGIEPEDLTIHRPNLDDVFLSLTGSSAESGAGNDGGQAEDTRKDR